MIRCFKPSPAVLRQPSLRSIRWINSGSSSSSGDQSNDEDKPFNVGITQKDLDLKEEEYDKFVKGQQGGKEFVEHSHKGYKSLQEKGTKTEEQQERPDDFM